MARNSDTPPQVFERQIRGPRVIWHRDGPRIAARILAVIQIPPTGRPRSPILELFSSGSEVATGFAEALHRHLALNIAPANFRFSGMWDSTRATMLPLFGKTAAYMTVGADIQTRIDFTNIENFSDEGLIENFKKIFESLGIFNYNIVSDPTLPLPQKRRRSLDAREDLLSNGAKQFCLNPSTEVFSLIDAGMEPSDDVVSGTACSHK